ncbi:CHASE2 domain-containing protein [Herbaspirillum chlorophenolicum]|uniref:histidine kinase n=1 Tax=Herbaspirillum chlorophenolicum TaxID=211589 RepID=A0ABW8EVY9_9BURK
MRTDPVIPPPSPAPGQRYEARRAWLRFEWLVLFCATLAAALLLQDGALRAADRIVYDHLVPTLERPAPDDIVIVAIDDKSIAELGRWPWKRGIHAQLVNVLNNGSPKAIGLDLLLTESDNANTAGDHALAAALARRHNVILPILTTRGEAGIAPRLPIPSLAAAAAGLGHIQLNIGGDGRVRNVNLHEYLGRYRWLAFGAALNRLASPDANYLAKDDGERLLRIPFFGPAGHFHHVSYIDVLHGTVPAAFFRDKTVLVGVVGAGLGDLFPIPQGSHPGLMSGVEIHANIFGTLREGRNIRTPSTTIAVVFTALPALLVLLGFTVLSPRAALGLSVLLTILVAAACMLLFRHDIWLAPSGSLLLLWLVYPLWSWRRLESALRYLDEETIRLAASVPLPIRPRPARRRWEFLERRIEAARAATRRMLDLHQFVADNLDSMPDANLVIDQEGRLMLFNRKAQELFLPLKMPLGQGQDIARLIASIASTQNDRSWPAHLMAGAGTAGIEITDPLGRILLVRGTASHNARGALIGWIISLTDLTALRTAERQRDQSLNFISHDMRAPQSAILAALSLYRQGKAVQDEATLFSRIEKSVRSTLSLADDFVLLARARSGPPQFEDLDMDSLLADAADDLWALAQDKQVAIAIDSDGQPHWIRGERQMLVRALGNVLANAIKYGPEQGAIRCSIALEGQLSQEVVCRIDDEGPGLSAADSAQVFAPFYRAGTTAQSGAGLGLNLVQTVVERHGGHILAENLPSGGARFILRLPYAQAGEMAEDQMSSSGSTTSSR